MESGRRRFKRNCSATTFSKPDDKIYAPWTRRSERFALVDDFRTLPKRSITSLML